MRRVVIRYVAWYLIMAMFVIGITPRVYAGFSPSEPISLSSSDRASDLQKIRQVVEMKMVRERLEELGFTQDEINKRLDQLSDAQIHQLALQLDELRVGGDGWAVVIVLLLIAAIVLLVMYLSGYRLIVTR
jgi:hypothetical protein